MSSKYKFLHPTGLHYITTTTVGWIDLFSRKTYRDILVDSLRWCQQNRGLHICAYVIMTNHLHLVAYTETIPLSKVIGTFKQFTARKIISTIKEQPESRREWLLKLLKHYGQKNRRPHQLWQHDNHPIGLWSQQVTGQKIDYIHTNPVRAGFVTRPADWLYSSAGAYTWPGFPSLLDVEVIDAWGLGKL